MLPDSAHDDSSFGPPPLDQQRVTRVAQLKDYSFTIIQPSYFSILLRVFRRGKRDRRLQAQGGCRGSPRFGRRADPPSLFIGQVGTPTTGARLGFKRLRRRSGVQAIARRSRLDRPRVRKPALGIRLQDRRAATDLSRDKLPVVDRVVERLPTKRCELAEFGNRISVLPARLTVKGLVEASEAHKRRCVLSGHALCRQLRCSLPRP
jgi:hypothetical protein